jgi:N-acyl-D-aspartate/D-glutamate deacylase
MLDLAIVGGTVVDGTGAEPRLADVGVHDGRIVAVVDPGGLAGHEVAGTVDARDQVVCPGFVDVHTHYDAQLLWDPAATPSPLHGVTTVFGGNCGFSIAPLADEGGDPSEHADYVQRMMARVEGIPLEALHGAGAWDWTTFGSWLDRLDGAIGVNAGFLVGHSTLRRVAMGERAVREPATDDDVKAMASMLGDACAAGALGLSSSMGEAHTDGDGRPVPSRAASDEELVALAAVLREHEGTTLEFIPAVGEISPERASLMAAMSRAAGRSLNWNLLGSLSPTEIWEQQLAASDVAEAEGAHVVALALPDVMRLRSDGMLANLAGWAEVVALSQEDRRAAAAAPEVRARLRAGVERAAASGIAALADWDLVEVTESVRWGGRTVASIAAELGLEPIDALIDVVMVDGLPLTMVLPSLVPSLGATDEGWAARVHVWRDPRVVLGGSDAGAHVDMMCHANYPTVVLGEVVRDRGLLGLAEAVQMMTDVPASLYGLRERGQVQEGWHADLVVFDPARVASGPSRAVHDLPGGGMRLHADAVGVQHVLVNGTPVVTHGAPTGAVPGTLLRSGRDTRTVPLPAPT